MVGGLRASAMCRFPANAPHLCRWGTVEVGGAVVSGSRSLPLRSSDGPIAKGVGAELECAAADGPVSTELTNVLFVQKHGTLEYISRCDSLDQLPKCCESVLPLHHRWHFFICRRLATMDSPLRWGPRGEFWKRLAPCCKNFLSKKKSISNEVRLSVPFLNASCRSSTFAFAALAYLPLDAAFVASALAVILGVSYGSTLRSHIMATY